MRRITNDTGHVPSGTMGRVEWDETIHHKAKVTVTGMTARVEMVSVAPLGGLLIAEFYFVQFGSLPLRDIGLEFPKGRDLAIMRQAAAVALDRIGAVT